MVSEAELRRQRFLNAKEAAGGTADQLIRSQRDKPVMVYFDDTGTIMCVTTDEVEPLPFWKNKHQFTQDQVEILQRKNHNLFYVKQDPLVDNLFSIESRAVESQYVSADSEFLTLVENNNTSAYDIKCNLTRFNFAVTAHKNLIKRYADVEPNNMVANGKKILKFYFTAPNDPHFMVNSFSINLANLISNSKVDIATTEDYSQCSVYTVKLFDKYVRT